MVSRAMCGALLLTICAPVLASQLGIDPNPKLSKEQLEIIDSIKVDTAAAYEKGMSENTFEWAEERDSPSPEGAPAADAQQEGARVERLEKKQGVSYVIYVSWSLGEPFIKSLLEEYRDTANVVLKFRGIPEGLTMVQALSKAQRLSLETKSPVAVEIDPVSFAENAVVMVPAIAKYKDGSVVAIAKGAAASEVFDSKPGVTDLGVVGDQAEITERDLIEEMKERASKIDFKALKEKAVNRFWSNQKFVELGHAPEDRLRKIDPTIVIPADMRTADGTLIHAEGTRINPLDIRPFNQRVVVIDPSVPWQLTLAKDQIDRFGRNQLVTIVLTSVEAASGWDQLKQIENGLGQPAYILPVEMKERFDLEFTPSIVTADSKAFFIQEFSRSNAK